MTYSAKLTSKGTTTIPAAIRKRLGMKPGMFVLFEFGKDSDEVILKRSLTIKELQALNQAALERAGTAYKRYRSGHGWRAYVREKYRKS
jgi:AbrB family looped-hinge helix DNA binding protein